MITLGVLTVIFVAWAQTLYYARELGRTRTALRIATDGLKTITVGPEHGLPYRSAGYQEQGQAPVDDLLNKQATCIKCEGGGIGRTYVKDSFREIIVAKCLCGAQWCEKVKS